MSIRVGLFSYDFYPIRGGQGRNFYELFRRFQLLRPEIEITAFSPLRNELEHHCAVLPAARRVPGAQIIFSAWLNAALPRIIRTHRLDCVVLNGPLGGVLLPRRVRGPVIYCVNHTYTQQARYIHSQSWKALFIPLEKMALRRADALVAISPSTRDELLRQYGIRSDEISLIPVGIDTRRFFPEEEGRRANELLYVGRLDERKGVRFLFEALPLIAARCPEARLRVVGEGALRPALERMAAAQHVASHVEFMGWVPETQLIELYRRSRALLVPSRFEGLGVAALEALACGTPVVATDTPGLRDVVRDNRTGYLVPFGDSQALAQSAITLLTDAERWKRFSRESVQYVQEHFAWERIVRAYASLIRKTVQTARAAQ